MLGYFSNEIVKDFPNLSFIINQIVELQKREKLRSQVLKYQSKEFDNDQIK